MSLQPASDMPPISRTNSIIGTSLNKAFRGPRADTAVRIAVAVVLLLGIVILAIGIAHGGGAIGHAIGGIGHAIGGVIAGAIVAIAAAYLIWKAIEKFLQNRAEQKRQLTISEQVELQEHEQSVSSPENRQ